MKNRIRRVQASILMVLLAFLFLNAKMVAPSKEANMAVETDLPDYGVRAGVILVLTSDMELPLQEATVTAPERNYSQLSEEEVSESSEEIEEFTEVPESSEEIEEFTEVPEQSSIRNVESFIEEVGRSNSPYNASEEEVILLCKLVVAEARGEGIFGQELVARASINNAIKKGCNLIQDIQSGRYTSVINGVPCKGDDESTPVLEEDITPEIRQAVENALSGDLSEPILKMIAEEKGLDESFYLGGASYFYNPENVEGKEKEKRDNISVSFQYQNHVFYCSWD